MTREADALIDMIRRDRIEALGTEMYLHTFNSWQWYSCTYKPTDKGTPKERVWSDFSQMSIHAASEVIYAIRDTFNELDSRLARSRDTKN